MRTLVLSDIHANLTALEAVITDAAKFDRVFCLGDVVGYGPDPNECISLLLALPKLQVVMGNHDAALCGIIEVGNFNYDAQQALQVQASMLSAASLDWLELLDVEKDTSDLHMAHGSPRNPIWEYLLNNSVALENFSAFTSQVCLIGHTHVPSIFELNGTHKVRLLLPEQGDLWRSTKRFLLNPGSVGQPRDGNPKAAYVIFDDEDDTWQFRRVPYDVAAVQARMRVLGLPPRLIERLERGV
jgi:predicted phosphodiesterase